MDLGSLVLGASLGGLHVISGPDHLAAIAPIASACRARAWGIGLRWGFGHCGGVLLVAMTALLLRDLLPLEALSGWSERLVGIVLIGLGVWGFYRSMDQGVGDDSRGHGAGGEIPLEHGRERAAFAVGTLHGLAGSSHLLGVLPALAQPTQAEALTYLAGFAAGTIAAMALVASAFGWLAAGAERRGPAWRRRLGGATSGLAVAVGLVWLAG